MATTIPPGPPPATPPALPPPLRPAPREGRAHRRRRRARRGRGDRGVPRAQLERRAHVPPAVHRRRPARQGRPGPGRRRARRERSPDISLTATTCARSRSTSSRRSLRCTRARRPQIRSPSLSGVANRFIALTPGPEQRADAPGRRDAPHDRDAGHRRSRPDLQHARPRHARALQQVIQGSAVQYAGRRAQIQVDSPLLLAGAVRRRPPARRARPRPPRRSRTSSSRRRRRSPRSPRARPS